MTAIESRTWILVVAFICITLVGICKIWNHYGTERVRIMTNNGVGWSLEENGSDTPKWRAVEEVQE